MFTDEDIIAAQVIVAVGIMAHRGATEGEQRQAAEMLIAALRQAIDPKNIAKSRPNKMEYRR